METGDYFLPGHSRASAEDQAKAEEIYKDWPFMTSTPIALMCSWGGSPDPLKARPSLHEWLRQDLWGREALGP